MSFWDMHFLAGFSLALLIGIMFGYGYYILYHRSFFHHSYLVFRHRVDRSTLYMFLWLIVQFGALSLLHLWLDVTNLILFWR